MAGPPLQSSWVEQAGHASRAAYLRPKQRNFDLPEKRLGRQALGEATRFVLSLENGG
jgi:hypothetical protein